jgi:hypothetical protein
VYDHRLVRLCVDLKFNLFGNFLYLLILCFQSMYVALYTGIALGSPTPTGQQTNYYQMVNYTCWDLCLTLANDRHRPAQDNATLRPLRLLLLILSGFALLKELVQIFAQRNKYFRRFYINLIELHMYVSIDSWPGIVIVTHQVCIRARTLNRLAPSSIPSISTNVRVRRAFVVRHSGWPAASACYPFGHRSC